MSPYRLTKIEAPMRVSLAFHEAFNEHDVEGMLALVAPHCEVDHYAPAPGGTRYTGREALEAFWRAYFTEHPDVHRKIEDAYGMGKHCSMHWHLQQGEIETLRGIDVFKVQDDFIIELRSYVKG